MARAKRNWNRINSQILVWAGDERFTLRYDGSPIVLPAVNEAAKLGRTSPFRWRSAEDSSGNLIPGTLEVTDLVQRTPEGGVIKTFDVTMFCEFLERDKAQYFEQGLDIVSDWKNVEAAKASARPLWERSQDQRAQRIIQTELERQQKQEAKGQPATEASNAERVAWAVAHLQHRRTADVATFSSNDLRQVLTGKFVPASTPKAPAVEPPETYTPKQVMAQADEVGLKLNKTELEALIQGDPEQIEFILAKIKGRRERQSASA